MAKLQPHPASNICAPAGQQPHLAEIRRWRRQSVQMGRQICVCLSSSNPVDRYNLADRPFQRSGNSPAQTSASLHPPAALRLRVLPFTRTWSSTVCAEEFPTPLETLHGRPWEAGIATSAGKESNLPEGSIIGKQPAGREHHREAAAGRGDRKNGLVVSQCLGKL